MMRYEPYESSWCGPDRATEDKPIHFYNMTGDLMMKYEAEDSFVSAIDEYYMSLDRSNAGLTSGVSDVSHYDSILDDSVPRASRSASDASDITLEAEEMAASPMPCDSSTGDVSQLSQARQTPPPKEESFTRKRKSRRTQRKIDSPLRPAQVLGKPRLEISKPLLDPVFHSTPGTSGLEAGDYVINVKPSDTFSHFIKREDSKSYREMVVPTVETNVMMFSAVGLPSTPSAPVSRKDLPGSLGPTVGGDTGDRKLTTMISDTPRQHDFNESSNPPVEGMRPLSADRITDSIKLTKQHRVHSSSEEIEPEQIVPVATVSAQVGVFRRRETTCMPDETKIVPSKTVTIASEPSYQAASFRESEPSFSKTSRRYWSPRNILRKLSFRRKSYDVSAAAARAAASPPKSDNYFQHLHQKRRLPKHILNTLEKYQSQMETGPYAWLFRGKKHENRTRPEAADGPSTSTGEQIELDKQKNKNKEKSKRRKSLSELLQPRKMFVRRAASEAKTSVDLEEEPSSGAKQKPEGKRSFFRRMARRSSSNINDASDVPQNAKAAPRRKSSIFRRWSLKSLSKRSVKSSPNIPEPTADANNPSEAEPEQTPDPYRLSSEPVLVHDSEEVKWSAENAVATSCAGNLSDHATALEASFTDFDNNPVTLLNEPTSTQSPGNMDDPAQENMLRQLQVEQLIQDSVKWTASDPECYLDEGGPTGRGDIQEAALDDACMDVSTDCCELRHVPEDLDVSVKSVEMYFHPLQEEHVPIRGDTQTSLDESTNNNFFGADRGSLTNRWRQFGQDDNETPLPVVEMSGNHSSISGIDGAVGGQEEFKRKLDGSESFSSDPRADISPMTESDQTAGPDESSSSVDAFFQRSDDSEMMRNDQSARHDFLDDSSTSVEAFFGSRADREGDLSYLNMYSGSSVTGESDIDPNISNNASGRRNNEEPTSPDYNGLESPDADESVGNISMNLLNDVATLFPALSPFVSSGYQLPVLEHYPDSPCPPAKGGIPSAECRVHLPTVDEEAMSPLMEHQPIPKPDYSLDCSGMEMSEDISALVNSAATKAQAYYTLTGEEVGSSVDEEPY